MSKGNIYNIAEVRVVYEPDLRIFKRPNVTHSSESYALFRENYDDALIGFQEHFKVMLLNRGNRVLGISTISQGGVSGTLVDSKIIFALAIKAMASGIIIAHNHPSGNTRPSESDIRLTRKLKAAANLLDITLVDHIILSPEPDRYYSFADEHML